jgi:hypothetical protein
LILLSGCDIIYILFCWDETRGISSLINKNAPHIEGTGSAFRQLKRRLFGGSKRGSDECRGLRPYNARYRGFGGPGKLTYTGKKCKSRLKRGFCCFGKPTRFAQEAKCAILVKNPKHEIRNSKPTVGRPEGAERLKEPDEILRSCLRQARRNGVSSRLQFVQDDSPLVSQFRISPHPFALLWVRAHSVRPSHALGVRKLFEFSHIFEFRIFQAYGSINHK